MSSAREVFVQQFEVEFKAFLSALDGAPEDLFSTTPHEGGHSLAWHALHISEWTRAIILQDHTATYAHLGWEDKEWTQALRGPTRVSEDSGKGAVLGELQAVTTEAMNALRDLQDDALNGNTRTPFGDRPLPPTLGGQLRHIAYHRGQVKLVALQLNKARL